MESSRMSLAYILLKILTIILVVFFLTDVIMQNISYSFYKGNQPIIQSYKNVDKSKHFAIEFKSEDGNYRK